MAVLAAFVVGADVVLALEAIVALELVIFGAVVVFAIGVLRELMDSGEGEGGIGKQVTTRRRVQHVYIQCCSILVR